MAIATHGPGSAQPSPLTRLLRRCPLLPSELALLEQRLQALLEHVSPDELGTHLARALTNTPVAARSDTLDQALRGVRAPPLPSTDGWQHEGARVVAALVSALGRLHCRRGAGLALYAVANLAAGPRGTQLLGWAQHAIVLPRLLQENSVLPWLRWLCTLPLPSLRDGDWVEPLIALLPGGLLDMLQQLDSGHAALHAHLQLPTSPVRLLLAGTAWALWYLQPPHAAPSTRAGRQIARLPVALDQLDLAGSAVRSLFARSGAPTAPARATGLPSHPPASTSAAEATRLLHPALPVALATTAVLPALSPCHGRQRAAALVAGLAAATAGGSLILWALDDAHTTAIAQMGERIDLMLYRAPATRQARALGTALARRMAVLPDVGNVAAQARVVLDLPLDLPAPTFRQALRTICGVDDAIDDALLDAAAGWALRRRPRSLAPQEPEASVPATAAPDDAAAQDQATLIEVLWALRDAASATGTAPLPRIAFSAAEGSPFARALQAVREQLRWLYRQDDFLGTLYAERTPPSSLVVANGSVIATRTMSNVEIVLHPGAPAGTVWSSPTAALLADLQRTVLAAGGCFDNHLRARVDCALGFYLGEDVSASARAPGAFDPLIHRLERALQQQPDGQVAPTHETATLRRLQQQVQHLKAMPIRGLAPDWDSWRPDPRSHLGHNIALARNLLLQVSQHAEVIALCWHHHADPSQLSYPAQGPVYARALQGARRVALFEAGQPPTALGGIDTLLRSIATLLHAPVRSDGRLRVPEMLAYYAAPLPAIPIEDAQFDASLAALERQLAAYHPPSADATRVEVDWDVRTDSPALQDHQRLLARLWERFDAQPATLDQALAHHSLALTGASPLQGAWQAGQELLQQVFEQPEVWLEMRRLNASFHSLRVGTDGITARLRGSDRSVVVSDGLAAPLQGPLAQQLEALYRTTDRLGRFSPGSSVPLANALQFHGALPRPAQPACAAPVPCTQAVLLDAIARVHARWQRHAGPLPEWRQASNELQDLRSLLAHHPVAADATHRAALGTPTAAHLYPALQAFAHLIAAPELQAWREREGLVPGWIAVDGAGSVQVQNGTSTGSWQFPPALEPSVNALHGAAVRIGGQVRSDGRLAVSDLLAAQGGCGPHEAAHADGAAQCVERLLGELRLGMRADLLHAADALSAAELEQVRRTTAGFMAQRAPGEQTLLEYLARPLVQRGEMAWNELHRSSHFLAAMARTPRAAVLQAALLRDLGWYMGSPAAPTSPTLIASLTRVAIVLDLGPASDRDARILLGYRLHKYANWGRTFAQIRLDIHDYLRSMGRIPDSMLGLAATLVLQDHAPELLATDVPANLVYGNTIASINFVSGAHLAERIRRGLSQQMRFSELVSLSADLVEDGDAPDLVKQLTLEARRLPTLDWYVFRQLESQGPPRATEAGRIDAAMQAFDQRVANIERAIGDVLAPLPYRMALVEADIHRVFPQFPGLLAEQPWNSTDFRLCNDANHFGTSFPFHEIVAAGELRNGSAHWRPCRTFVPSSALGYAQGNPRYEAALQTAYAQMKPGLARLTDINARYQRRFDAYFRKAQRGYGVLIEEALYQRPEEERAALREGNVEVFTLRTHEPDLEAQQETRNDTDPYRGRFGVLYTLNVTGQRRHFQLFPLQSRIVPLLLDGPLPLGGELQNRKVRLRSGNVATVRVRRGTPLPVDWEAYASDKAPADGRMSDVIVEPLLVPPAGNDTGARSPFHALVDPIQRGFFWLDPAVFRREGWAPTSYELHLDDAPLWLKTVDFIVPFVENLRRISSKNRNEFAMAAFGLYLESIIVVGPMVSGVVKVLARPGLKLTLPRFAELSRVLGRGTLDALNPAAGSLALLRVGVSVVRRTASGNLRFLWTLMDPKRPPARAAGMRWVMREGMAIAKEGGSLASPLYEIKVRTVDGIPGAMVSPPPIASGSRTLHLVDPATLTLYGPALQERLGEGGGAAGMLIKVGGTPRTPHVSPGKALKPIKQGPKASDEEPDEGQPPPQPPVVILPDHRGRGMAGPRP